MASQGQANMPVVAGFNTSTQDVFEAFDNYPWKKDRGFLTSLIASVGGPASLTGNPAHVETCVRARISYYSRLINIEIDYAEYMAWANAHSEHESPDRECLDVVTRAKATLGSAAHSTAGARSVPVPAPEWQRNARLGPLHISRPAARGNSDGQASSEEAPYPERFAEIIKAISSGKPIPGFRQIPDKVSRNTSTKPMGSLKAPKKPWEKSAPGVAPPDMAASTILDPSFPPVPVQAKEEPNPARKDGIIDKEAEDHADNTATIPPQENVDNAVVKANEDGYVDVASADEKGVVDDKGMAKAIDTVTDAIQASYIDLKDEKFVRPLANGQKQADNATTGTHQPGNKPAHGKKEAEWDVLDG